MNVGIVGLGLIGSSYALSLSKHYRIYGFDVNKQVEELAIKQNIIHESVKDKQTIINKSDILIIALPPKETQKFLEEYGDILSNLRLCFDVCGVKDKLQESFLKISKTNVNYLSVHPMAGKEKGGIENAQNNLFKNKNCLYFQVSGNQKAIEICRKLHSQIGFTHFLETSIDQHDQRIAYTSQLPHIISVAFMNALENRNIFGFTGGSFEDLTRVANINSDLWSALFLDNSESLLDEIEKFEQQLRILKQGLNNKDVTQLKEALKSSAKNKQMIKDQLLGE